MYLINGLLILAMVFFFILPINDYKTARMKLCVICTLAACLTASTTLIGTRAPLAKIAGLIR